MRRRWYFFAPIGIIAIAPFIFIGTEIVMHLWNWLLPPLFGWRMLTFWQALGLLVLCRILFGNFGMRGGPHYSMRRRMRERMAERWERMTPEERERARQRWGGRCGWGADATDAHPPQAT